MYTQYQEASWSEAGEKKIMRIQFWLQNCNQFGCTWRRKVLIGFSLLFIYLFIFNYLPFLFYFFYFLFKKVGEMSQL